MEELKGICGGERGTMRKREIFSFPPDFTKVIPEWGLFLYGRPRQACAPVPPRSSLIRVAEWA